VWTFFDRLTAIFDSSEEPVMSKTILVVDDSASFRTVVKLALQKAGYTVVEAGDGQDALGKLNGAKVNLIVCDVNMPIMDGLAFLKQVKTMAAYKFTPVIMLTTESQESKKAEGRAAGAKAWITKPFQPSQLVDAVNRLCV
jgi:two-component system chemotaxis response regulator CheY